MSRNHIKPGTVNGVCTRPWHGDGRGTATTLRWIDGDLVPLWGIRPYSDYESGIDTWSSTCRCGFTAQASEARWREAAQMPTGVTRVDLDITTLTP